jgi:ferredoxin-like protein FixX
VSYALPINRFRGLIVFVTFHDHYDNDDRINEALADRLSEAQKLKIVDSCPTRVYAYREATRQLVVDEESKCMFCQVCIHVEMFLP